jgi:hypothetical protein
VLGYPGSADRDLDQAANEEVLLGVPQELAKVVGALHEEAKLSA